ncbi:Uncharacterised protein [BD1-7 clade bacterium]|uniref:Uncharacterized protein n=1 Tax=BD1-7 clade bacterium TaxID=2029982 RepID=A0A5S9QBU6_9GAMM|nr:Uncharacterised protein [BD1-7 clade bacterium]
MTTNTSPVMHARKKMRKTGIHLEYSKQYRVKLILLKPIVDWYVPCNFAGWDDNFLQSHRQFHNMSQKFSLLKNARMMSLIGEVGGHRVDLGKRWRKADKQPFVLCLKELLPGKPVEGELKVCLNDASGFFWNNRGSYQLEIETL